MSRFDNALNTEDEKTVVVLVVGEREGWANTVKLIVRHPADSESQWRPLSQMMISIALKGPSEGAVSKSEDWAPLTPQY